MRFLAACVLLAVILLVWYFYRKYIKPNLDKEDKRAQIRQKRDDFEDDKLLNQEENDLTDKKLDHYLRKK